MIATVTQIGPQLGIAPTCAALGLPRATYYRRRRPQRALPARARSPRALSTGEQATVLDVLHEPRFVDQAPAEVYATLLDEGHYHCSERTMYRLLAERVEVRERRDQLRHPTYAAPELLACRPNELWSWDITKLLGPITWTYFYLYVMLDVFSRYVVSQRSWAADALRRASRIGRAAGRGAGGGPGYGLWRASRTLPRRASPAAGVPHRSLDQSPRGRLSEYRA